MNRGRPPEPDPQIQCWYRLRESIARKLVERLASLGVDKSTFARAAVKHLLRKSDDQIIRIIHKEESK